MALSHVELYEALKPSIGEQAASLIAEVFPAAKELATKTDIVELRAEMREGFAQLRIIRWLFGLFLPIWVGTWATFVVYLIKK